MKLKETFKEELKNSSINNYNRKYYNINISKKSYIILDNLALKNNLKKSKLLDLIIKNIED
tara:strand:+ start:303 stop:485 length:183 start_codon:yes stop_codon:yes gene_type:complete